MTAGSSGAWLVLNSGPSSAAFNMALDEALLEAMPAIGKPVLRFYSWTAAAASFGYFQKYAEIEKLTLLRPLVRRPTGGGLVPHDRDWTYSLSFPVAEPWYAISASQSYVRMHEWICAAFQHLGAATELAPSCRKAGPGQCFEGHEKFDLLWQGKKIAGAAQRRTRTGLLIQGSVQPPPVSLSRQAWEAAMCRCQPDAAWTEFQPEPLLLERAASLERSKYLRDDYNKRR